MDLEALRASPLGRLVPISGTDPRVGNWTYFAFEPAPLPVEPELTLRAVNAASKAAMAVVRLDEALFQLPNPGLLVRPFVRREAVSTSALEGTYAAFDEVLEAEFIEDRHMSADQREAYNYVRATDTAIRLLEKYPLSRTVVGQLQKCIVQGTSGDTYDAGDLRQRLVKIGAPGQPIEESRYVPPPNGQILEEGFSNWEKWINGDSEIPIVAKVAIAHYQFESLHPYNDGNGRVGRLLAILQLIQEGVLRHPILNIAPWFEARRDQYISGLFEVTLTGDFNPWVELFSEAVRSQAEDGILTIRELLNQRDLMVSELREAGFRGSGLHIAENLIGYPIIDVPTVRDMIGRSFEAANQAVARLVDFGLLREITGKKMNRLFVCDRVLRITSQIGRHRT
ncbi:Fic family protein [Micromonospora craterilacus]|uniref:Fic family protein n=1 Tax=Micromonospora craterilacus TaxID=1655439 RepID=A0A2W2DFH3_9ACTN|nr:Fic/DOC family N-terminal domain-containing protein [Micromonospora craterilacus]PZG10632.1 Fic family protein [Micromonospora craterilacus]